MVYKLNVDGLSLGNFGRTGEGIIIRDNSGQVVCAVAFLHVSMQRFFSFFRGLELCLGKGLHSVLHSVLIETDSQLLVSFLIGRAAWPWCYHSLVLYRIKQILSHSDFHIRHIFR